MSLLGKPSQKISWAKKLLLNMDAPHAVPSLRIKNSEVRLLRNNVFHGKTAAACHRKFRNNDSLKISTAVSAKETLNELISQGGAKSPAPYNEALRYFVGTFLKDFFDETIDLMQRQHVKPDTETINIYLESLVSWPEVAFSTPPLQMLQHTLSYIADNNINKDEDTEYMIFAVTARFDFEKAYEELASEKSSTSISSKRKVKCLIKNSPSVLRAFIMVKEFGLDPTCPKISFILVQVCRRLKDIKSAQKAFDLVKEPTYSNYRSLWLVYADDGNVDEVIKITERCNKAFPQEPIDVFVQYIILAASVCRNEDDRLRRKQIALTWYNKAARENCATSVGTLAALLSLCGDDVQTAEKLRSDLQTHSLPETRGFFSALTKVYQAAGLPPPTPKRKILHRQTSPNIEIQ